MVKKEVDRATQLLIAIDDRARKLFEPFADSIAIRALHPVSKLGDQPELRTLAILLIGAGTFAQRESVLRAGARMIIAHEAATFTKDFFKNKIDRTRPRSGDDGTDRKLRKGKHRAKEETSFPSGHSAGAIAVARAFSREFPQYGAAAICGALCVAALQVARGAHYPTDVMAGALIGIAAEAMTNTAWNAARMNEPSAVAEEESRLRLHAREPGRDVPRRRRSLLPIS